MRQLLIFIKKEFFHILRDPKSMLVLLGMPIIQIVIFGFAITTEIRNSSIAILDNSRDEMTQTIITRIGSSHYFSIDRTIKTEDEVLKAFQNGKIKMALIFQPNFQNDLMHTNKAQIQMIADATDPNNATTTVNYASSIIADYQNELLKTNVQPYSISVVPKMLYNPQSKGVYSSVPGVMGLILLLLSAMMTSISIVKEREMGTMEVLLVSPIRPWLIILSKMIPYFILSFINIVTILLLSVYVLGMPIEGSALLLFALSTLYIFCALALGLLISTLAKTQEEAMFISLIGLMLPIMLLSGYIFPVANMPTILQVISNIVPAKWYIIIVKSVMLKGLGLANIWREVVILNVMTAFFIVLSIVRFKTRL